MAGSSSRYVRDCRKNMLMAAPGKLLSVKLWAALAILLAVCAWVLPVGIRFYRDWKSTEYLVDQVNSGCARIGSRTVDAGFDL